MTLEAELVESLAPRARSVSLADGEVLVEQGDAADKVYFIESGRMSASKSTPQGDVVVGTVEAGHVIGEVTVVAGGLRTATCLSRISNPKANLENATVSSVGSAYRPAPWD